MAENDYKQLSEFSKSLEYKLKNSIERNKEIQVI